MLKRKVTETLICLIIKKYKKGEILFWSICPLITPVFTGVLFFTEITNPLLICFQNAFFLNFHALIYYTLNFHF